MPPTPPHEFICPITLEMMRKPLISRWGQSYERSAILGWLAQGGECPMTRNPMSPSDLIPNPALEARIAGWRLEHGLAEHEPEQQDCKYAVSIMHISKKPGMDIMTQYQPPAIRLEQVARMRLVERAAAKAASREAARTNQRQRRNILARILTSVSKELQNSDI